MNNYEIKFDYKRFGEDKKTGYFSVMATDILTARWGAFQLFTEEVLQNPYLIDKGDKHHPFSKLDSLEIIEVKEMGAIEDIVLSLE